MGTKVDLTNMIFSRLKVIEYAGNGKWKCECSCDKKTIKYVRTHSLTSGDTKSCGCLHSEIVREKRRNSVDLAGKTINNVEVISYSHSGSDGTYWICRCKLCGKESVLLSAHAINRNKSCGCLEKEMAQKGSRKLIDGNVMQTNIHKITKTNARSDSGTGIRGVRYSKRDNVYTATIGFQGKRYYLGSYVDINKAMQARKAAEKKIYDEFLDWYHNEFAKQNDSETE